jgi:GTP-binding protein
MRITSSKFLVGVADLAQLPGPHRPEIACIGRSNVGKSSFISALCRSKGLARSSNTPGKTREINYYLINDSVCLVDLPGYGFARLPDQLRSSLSGLIEGYLKSRKNLILALHLVDARHEPTALDLMMAGWLDFYAIPFLVVLSKADKIPRSRRSEVVNGGIRSFAKFGQCQGAVLFSSVSGEGRPEVLGTISRFINGDS